MRKPVAKTRPATTKRAAPAKEAIPAPAVPKDDPERRAQALSFKLSGASDFQISRQLGYESTAACAADLRVAYEAMALLEPVDARKLHVARVEMELLRVSQALAAYLERESSAEKRLRAISETTRAKLPLLSLLARIEGTLAPTLNLHGGKIEVGPVSEMTDHELEQLLRSNGVLVPAGLPEGSGGGARAPAPDPREGGEPGEGR